MKGFLGALRAELGLYPEATPAHVLEAIGRLKTEIQEHAATIRRQDEQLTDAWRVGLMSLRAYQQAEDIIRQAEDKAEAIESAAAHEARLALRRSRKGLGAKKKKPPTKAF